MYRVLEKVFLKAQFVQRATNTRAIFPMEQEAKIKICEFDVKEKAQMLQNIIINSRIVEVNWDMRRNSVTFPVLNSMASSERGFPAANPAGGIRAKRYDVYVHETAYQMGYQLDAIRSDLAFVSRGSSQYTRSVVGLLEPSSFPCTIPLSWIAFCVEPLTVHPQETEK